MIKFENRFDDYAYILASVELDDSVTELHEGQFVTFKGGKIAIATPTSKKAFIAMGSVRTGRDQVSGRIVKKISILVGPWILSVDTFDAAKTYDDDMTALTVNAEGKLTPVTASEQVVAYAIGKPENGFLRIVSA